MNKRSFVQLKHIDLSLVFLTICVATYLSAVFCLTLRTNWFTFFVLLISIIFGLSFSYQKLKNVTIQLQNYKPISFWYFFSISITFSVILLYVIYPGPMNPDIIFQLNEIKKESFTNWHPAIHTLLIWLGLRPFSHIMCATVYQTIIFNIINSSLFHELSKRHYPKWMVLTGFFISLISPATISHVPYLIKDSLFSIFILALTEMFILTYISDGKWIKSNIKVVLFGIILGFASLLRHNGILFTIPFLLIFSYLFYNKYILRLIFIAIATIFIIKVPIYSYFDVKPHHQVKEELCGLPTTILCEIFVKNPTILDKETTDFMLSVVDYDIWKKYYKTGSMNSIKWPINKLRKLSNKPQYQKHLEFNDLITKFSISKLLKKSFKASIKDPQHALEGILNATQRVWALVHNTFDLIYINPRIDVKLRYYLQQFFLIYCIIFRFAFIIGLYIIILLLSMFFSFHRLRWKAFWIISPILIYNFGTMLVLCGPEDFRFFFFNTLITLPYMILLFSPKKYVS